MSIPTECPYCECELEHQEAEQDIGLFFSGAFCPECDFEISSDDFVFNQQLLKIPNGHVYEQYPERKDD